MQADPRLTIGSVFAGDYRVIKPLDEGGMGLVYRVEQLSTGEQRALKVLKPRLLADARSRDRFNQEATVGSHIPSEHVVKVIAAGIDDESGVPWLAMELLEGENLQDTVRARGPLPRAEVLETARQLCHALHAAHANGVVHRDLKPENVFVAQALRPGGGSTIKLLDFGIARVLQDFETSATPTAVLGSPLWMAPEQIKRARIRPATDVWALGLLVFYALAGKVYWRSASHADDGGPAPVEALLHEKLFEPIEPASRRADELGCEFPLPRGFDAWFARCVARDPDDRFRDAGEAFEALEAVLERGQVERRGARRWAVVSGACALALVATIVVARARGAASAVHTTTPPTSAAREPAGPRERVEAAVLPRPEPAALTGPAAPSPTPATARPHATDSAGHPHPHAAAATTTTHTLPRAEGYSFRAERDWRGYCASPEFSRAWRAVPDWFAIQRDELRREGDTLAAERRAQTPGTAPEIEQHAQAFAARERAFEALRARQLPNERRRIGGLAHDSGCATSGGLIEEDDALYAIWCCP